MYLLARFVSMVIRDGSNEQIVVGLTHVRFGEESRCPWSA